MLPDLINFDAPSASGSAFEDYHTMGLAASPSNAARTTGTGNSEASASTTFDDYHTKSLSLSPSHTVREKGIDSTDAASSAMHVKDIGHPNISRSMSLDDYHTPSDLTPSPSSGVRVNEMENSYVFESPLFDGASALSEREIDDEKPVCKSGTDCVSDAASMCSAMSLSSVVRAKETEDSYVFEAGYLLAMAARCEDRGQYRRAFHCYRAGIEKMLIGVRCEYTFVLFSEFFFCFCDSVPRGVIK